MDKKRKEPVNILSIENGTGPGGAFKCGLNIAGALDKGSFRSHVFIPKDWALYEKLPSGLTVISVRQSIFREIGSDIKLMINFIFGIIPFIIVAYIYCKKNNIKLMVLNNDMYSNCGGILAASLLKIPCVLHCRGLTYDSFFMRFLSRRVTLFLAVSECIRKSYKELGIEDRRIRIAHDGERPDRYDPGVDITAQIREFPAPSGTFSIGAVSMLTEWKGQDILLKAAKGVLEEAPNCRFFIIGDSASRDDAYKKHLVALAEELGIGDKVIFTGYRSDVPEMLKMLDLVIHAPKEPDPLPGVVIQAAAMKKTIIASRCGGIPDIIKDGEDGVLFEPGDVEGLRAAIAGLLKDMGKRERLAENARKVFLEKFTLDMTIKKVEEAYEDALS